MAEFLTYFSRLPWRLWERWGRGRRVRTVYVRALPGPRCYPRRRYSHARARR